MAATSPFVGCELTLSIPLSPATIGQSGAVQLGAARAAVSEMLLKYNAEIGGVLMAFSRLRFSQSKATRAASGGGGGYVHSATGAPLARIFDELPVVHVRVTMDALIFRPRIGQLLKGRVHHPDPSYLGVLVSGVFNASVAPADMGGAYTFDEAARAWVATGVTGGGVIAGNPARIAQSDDVVFCVTSLRHSGGMLSLTGSLVASPGGEARDPLLEAAAAAAAASQAASRGAASVAASTANARKGSAASAAIEDEEEDDVAVKKEKKEKKEKKDKEEKKDKKRKREEVSDDDEPALVEPAKKKRRRSSSAASE